MTRSQEIVAGRPDSLAEAQRPLVLVIDDDEAIRDALRELLDDAGFSTIGARHGREGLEILARVGSAPSFILLDLMMPIMDGWTFCERRGQDRRLREIPVIAISAVEVPDSNRPAGVDAFLMKPIDLERFASLALRLAGRKARRRPAGLPH